MSLETHTPVYHSSSSSSSSSNNICTDHMEQVLSAMHQFYGKTIALLMLLEQKKYQPLLKMQEILFQIQMFFHCLLKQQSGSVKYWTHLTGIILKYILRMKLFIQHSVEVR